MNTETQQPSAEAAPQAAPASNPNPNPAPNPAVARCRQAYNAALQAEVSKGTNAVLAKYAAIKAYRTALPALDSYENIRDFIASVTQGMLMDVIDSAQSARLLYAAQVAVGAVRANPANRRTNAA